MNPHRRAALNSLWLALGATLVSVATTMAGCFGFNEGAASLFVGSDRIRGTASDVNLQAATPLSGAAIAHPLQVLAPGADDDFLGWGTYKSRGPEPDNCPQDTIGWNVYADGVSYDVYFCRVEAELPDDPSYRNFRVNHTTCPTSGKQRWVFLLQEVNQTCNAMGNWDYADATAAGGESVGTTSTQTIDVYYKDTRWRQASVGWQYWGPPEATCPIDAGYRIRRGLAGTANYYHDFYAERIP